MARHTLKSSGFLYGRLHYKIPTHSDTFPTICHAFTTHFRRLHDALPRTSTTICTHSDAIRRTHARLVFAYFSHTHLIFTHTLDFRTHALDLIKNLPNPRVLRNTTERSAAPLLSVAIVQIVDPQLNSHFLRHQSVHGFVRLFDPRAEKFQIPFQPPHLLQTSKHQ